MKEKAVLVDTVIIIIIIITEWTDLSDLLGGVDQVPHVTVQLIFPPISCCLTTGTAYHKTAWETVGGAKRRENTEIKVCVCD